VTSPDVPSGLEPKVTYVVITPDGEMLVRTADNTIGPDESGTPYQETLWAQVRGEVDPHMELVNGVELTQPEMRLKVADAAMTESVALQFPRQYPPNPVASAMLSSLGETFRGWFGVVAFVGAEDEQAITASLTVEQVSVLARAHRLATSNA
jgi:hypothetical protein